MVSSAFGGMGTFEEQVLKLARSGPSKVSPFCIPAILGNTASGVIAIESGAKGPNYGLVSACASATHSIGEAMKTIRAGEVGSAAESYGACCKVAQALLMGDLIR